MSEYLLNEGIDISIINKLKNRGLNAKVIKKEINNKIKFLQNRLNLKRKKVISLLNGNFDILLKTKEELNENIEWILRNFAEPVLANLLKDPIILTFDIINMDSVLNLLNVNTLNKKKLYDTIGNHPQILTIDEEKFKFNVEIFKLLGINIKYIIKSCSYLFALEKEQILSVIELFNNNGYKSDQIITILRGAPQIFDMDVESIGEREDLVLNITKEVYDDNFVKQFFTKNPKAFLRNENVILNCFNAFFENNFTKEEIINLTIYSDFSYINFVGSLFSEKIKLIVSLGLKDKFMENPIKFLSCPMRVINVRLEFFKENGIDLIDGEHLLSLFDNEYNFFKKYGVYNNELINMYDALEKPKILKKYRYRK